jgi:pyrroline-5-carboxylate reductase
MGKLPDMAGGITLGVIGCGNMGGAFVEGVVTLGVLAPETVAVADADESRAKSLEKRFGVVSGPTAAAAGAGCVVLAVKQKDLPGVCAEISREVAVSSVVVTVVAGIPVARVETMIGTPAQVVRMMPNLAVARGKGVLGFSLGKFARPFTVTTLETIFGPLGFLFPLHEEMMPLLTAVSGSGPGYLFYFGEIFRDILVKKGMDPQTALRVVACLFDGVGSAFAGSGLDPRELKEKVCSPAGTTLAGLGVMERRDIAAIFEEAVEAAETKAVELSRGAEKAS